MIVKVYDYKTLNAVCAVSKIKSLYWKSNFYSMGSFELYLPVNCDKLNFFKIGNLIREGGKTGIILYIMPSDESVKICGYDLKFFLNSRMVVPPFYYKDNPAAIDSQDRVKGSGETVMKYYVKNQCTEPADTRRKIANLVIAEDLKRGISNLAWQAKFVTVEKTLNSISAYTKLGYDIVFNPGDKQFVFDVYSGVDRTRNQSTVSPVIFAKKYKSLSSASYTNDYLESCNCVYVGGNGEEEEQYVQKMTAETASADFMIIEGYTNCSSDDVEEIDDAGLAYLEENKNKESVEGSVTSKLPYKDKWNLGDYVTLRLDIMGEMIYADRQIVSVTEEYQPLTGKTISAAFGTESENIIKRIAKVR